MAGVTIFGRMRIWGALLLAVILAHALLPIAPPTIKTSGSPFSASTIEVSTAPSRRSEVVEARQAQTDPVDRAEIAVVEPVPALELTTEPHLVVARGPPGDPDLQTYPTTPRGSSHTRAPPLS